MSKSDATERHDCQPPDYPEGWKPGWFCPVCDSYWIYEGACKWDRDD